MAMSVQPAPKRRALAVLTLVVMGGGVRSGGRGG